MYEDENLAEKVEALKNDVISNIDNHVHFEETQREEIEEARLEEEMKQTRENIEEEQESVLSGKVIIDASGTFDLKINLTLTPGTNTWVSIRCLGHGRGQDNGEGLGQEMKGHWEMLGDVMELQANGSE